MIGKTLGPYEVLDAVGKGGMGEVYRARDTKLGREVAIKVLPRELSGDPERAARFEREARLLASLQHANIASIYGFEKADGVQFLAMELIQGQTLEALLREGPLPADQVSRIAGQMAAGMEAAHDKGIVHRDLKPANVMITADGDVKILDFGLARAWYGEGVGEEDLSNSPTITAAMTQAGTILGTAAYMSPEQARGKSVDRRADIWAFGAILWEMLTGRRLFEGETISDTLAAVIRAEPQWDRLPADDQPVACALVERCLVRDPRQRLRDIGEARIQLQEGRQGPQTQLGRAAPEIPSDAPRGRPSPVPWVLAAVAIAVAAWALLFRDPGPEAVGVMRLSLSVQDELSPPFFSTVPLNVSPDGSLVVLDAREGSDRGLYLRRIGDDQARRLEGTADATNPIFSPDGQWIAFAQRGELKKISVSGGPPTRLCDAPDVRGMSWGSQGQIVFAPGRAAGLMMVPDSGGEAEPLTELEPVPAAIATPSHRWPEFLPDGTTVLYTSTPDDNNYEISDIVAVSLEDGSEKVLVKSATFPKYVPNGFLIFLRQNTLFAARFSADRLELLSDPKPVLEDIAFLRNYGSGALSVSDTGLLAYVPNTSTEDAERLVWVDLQGAKTPASAHHGRYAASILSPDGRRAVLEVLEPNRTNLWLLEFARDSLTRFTFDERLDRFPVWSPDGDWIAFSSFQGARSTNLFRKRSNGTGGLERLTQNPAHQNPTSWSPDGKILAFEQNSPETGTDIHFLRFDRDPPEPEVYLETPFNEGRPMFSRDGNWIAYWSDESGQAEIYVRPQSGNGGQVKVSSNGGTGPVWSPDGTELFYMDYISRELMSARFVVEDGEFKPELARRVIDFPRTYGMPFDLTGSPLRIFLDEDLMPESAAVRPPTVVVNWFEELEAKFENQ